MSFKLLLQYLWKQNKEDEQQRHKMIRKWPTNVIDLLRYTYLPMLLTLHTQYRFMLSTYPSMESTSFLIYAKSRIAPIKGISIPRFELLSILIGFIDTSLFIKSSWLLRATQWALKFIKLILEEKIAWL
ncbi:unnamed protein product [Dracunculus medinensis]|uniref:Uncharacterized protein n=1 Tax=Dracunculus medinensis TaxID=318479 RepID=A0A0N4UH82_DRAME|nr:unnamed protein product [Dracunculus medinensis]